MKKNNKRTRLDIESEILAWAISIPMFLIIFFQALSLA